MYTAIRVHPQDPKHFEFRGKPFAFVTATEHYGAVINRPFRFERYLADAAEKHMTLSRLFCLFRELQSAVNPYSTCKPESPDYIAPFRRTGPGRALDGEPQFDLDQWNPEFFERLHRLLTLASAYGIVVEVVLLSNTYEPRIWALNPLHARNNVNGLPEIEWTDYTTMRHSAVFARQAAHVRKIVEETNRYDNVIFEICNEPGGGFPGAAGAPAPAEVDVWQAALAEVIRETERGVSSGQGVATPCLETERKISSGQGVATPCLETERGVSSGQGVATPCLEVGGGLPNRHLIAGHEAFTYDPWSHPADTSFGGSIFDVVNIHPLPGISYRGARYDMGPFMSKQLCLRPFRDFCLDTFQERKPLNLDEDNVASQYKDVDGWTIHRKRAWTALMNGAHYDYIDFSIINYCETGTRDSQRHIRTWMRHLSEFIHSIDLPRSAPLRNWLKEQPPHTCESVLAVGDEDFCIYLADERELSDPGAGEPIHGNITVPLPEGPYRAATFSPVTGLYSPWLPIAGGPETHLCLPSFSHDLLLRISKATE